MSVKLKRFPELSFRWVLYSGAVTKQDLDYVTASVYGADSAGITPERLSLLDLSAVTSVEIDFNALLGTATRARWKTLALDQPMRVAILSSGDESYGMARVYHALLEGTVEAESQILESHEAAMKWLDLPENPIDLQQHACIEA